MAEIGKTVRDVVLGMSVCAVVAYTVALAISMPPGKEAVALNGLVVGNLATAIPRPPKPPAQTILLAVRSDCEASLAARTLYLQLAAELRARGTDVLLVASEKDKAADAYAAGFPSAVHRVANLSAIADVVPSLIELDSEFRVRSIWRGRPAPYASGILRQTIGLHK